MLHDDLLSLIDRVYEAGDEDRSGLLDDVARRVGVKGLVVVQYASGTDVQTLTSESLLAANADYVAGWSQRDTRVERALRLRLRPGLLVTDRDLLTDEEKRRDPFFREFLRRHALGDNAAYLAEGHDGRMMSIAHHGHADREGFERRELELIRILAPHLARSVAIEQRLLIARGEARDLRDVIENLSVGAILMTDRRKVIHVNRSARAALGVSLDIRGRDLSASSSNTQHLIDKIVSACLGKADSSGSVTVVPLGGQDWVLEAHRLPFRVRDGSNRMSPARVLITMRPLRGGPATDGREILRQLGLTRKEAEVADLVGQGEVVRDVAATLHVSEATIRTQLRSIFVKLDIQRQSQLANLVSVARRRVIKDD